MLRRKSEAQIVRRNSDVQRKPEEVSNKSDVRRKSAVKNSRKSVKSIPKPLRDYKFYFIESIRCGTYAGTLRSLIQELGGTTVAILPTLSKIDDAEKAKTVIIIDTLEKKPKSDSNKENLISPRESTSRDLLKLKLGNTRVLGSRSKLMLNLAKSKNQEKAPSPEDLEKTNKSEQDKYRIIAKKYKIHVFSTKGVHSWLKKQKEHTIKLALQEASNLCDPKSVPKIRPEGQAKVVDMLSQHRPRIFSTKHDMNYDKSKNPFRLGRVNRNKNEILKKLSDKLDFSKTGYLAKKLSKINVWDEQDSLEKSVKKEENHPENRLQGSLHEKSLQSLNFSNDSILKEIEFDDIETIKNSVIKDINKNELAHELKEGRKYCEVCKTQFDNVHWHWSTTLHTTAWEKSYEKCGDQFEKIEQDLDDKFDFENADSWEFNFGSELLNIGFQEKLLEEQNQALEEIRKDKIERDLIRKEIQERNRAQLKNSWLMRPGVEDESKEVKSESGDCEDSREKIEENVEFQEKSEENLDYEDDKPRLTQSEQDEDNEVCMISPKREGKSQQLDIIKSTNSDSGWVKLDKAMSAVTESEELRELDTDSEDVTTGNNSGNKSPRIIEINSEKLTTDGFSDSRAATPNEEINNIRGTPRRKTRDLTDSKMHIHGDDFCYDNDDDGSSGLDVTIQTIPSAFRNGRQVSGPGSRPGTPKSVRKVKIEHHNSNSNPNSRVSTPTRKMTSTPKFRDSPKSTSVKRKRENGQIGSPFPKALKNMSPKIVHVQQLEFVPSSAELAKTRRRNCQVIKTEGTTPGSGTFAYSPNVQNLPKKKTTKKKIAKQLKYESDSLESGEIRSEIVTSETSNSSSVKTKVPRKLIISPTRKFIISPTKHIRAVLDENNSAPRHLRLENMVPKLCDYSQTDDSDTNSALSQISSSTCTQTSETSSYRRAPRRAVRDSKPPLLQAMREKHQSEHINYLQLHDEAEWHVYNESGSASGMSTASGKSSRSRRKQKQLHM